MSSSRPSNAKHVSPAISVGVLAVALLVAYLYFTCSVSPKDPTNQAPQPLPSASEPQCRMCSEQPSPPGFFFIGAYLDARCTELVAHADVLACSTVKAHGPAKVLFTQGTPTHKASTMGDVTLVRQIVPDEARFLFRKTSDGRCERFSPTGLKIAPAGCDGKMICRGSTGNLACGGCRLLPNGCPDYEGARLFVLIRDQ